MEKIRFIDDQKQIEMIQACAEVVTETLLEFVDLLKEEFPDKDIDEIVGSSLNAALYAAAIGANVMFCLAGEMSHEEKRKAFLDMAAHCFDNTVNQDEDEASDGATFH